MAWQDVTPIIGSSSNAKGLVRYTVGKKMGCTISLPAAVGDELLWKAGTHLKLSVGGGDLFGKLKLVEDPAALPVVKGSKGGTLVVRLGRWAQLPEREVDRIAVEHQVEGRALIITLPSHALAVAPTRVGAAAPAPAPASRIDVTEKIAGRNGGGRTELAAGTRTSR